jgi:nitrite reductase/ring-hydroxylating ferredoxin subunit
MLHLGVYVAYLLLFIHVAAGVMQTERSLVLPTLLSTGFLLLLGLHVAAARTGGVRVATKGVAAGDGFVDVGAVEDFREGRGRVVSVGGRRLAVFQHLGRIFATSNVCRHQGGPLGEGRILDGCITCPWHGWNYRPEDGCSPPPFVETVETYTTRVLEGRLWVRAEANPLRTVCPGSRSGKGGLE